MSEQTLGQTSAPSQTGSDFVFEPIPGATLRELRTTRIDEAGNQLTVQTDANGGNPLRCCLRESAPGEQLLLLAYTPPGTRGPYAERGPVFIHAEPCAGYLTPGRYPPGLSDRRQVVRAYDAEGRIADGILVGNGEHAMTVIRELFTLPNVALVHLRNVGYGCYNFAVRRA